MNDSLQDLTNVDRVIHEPARLMIMTILSLADRVDFLYLLNETGLTKGNLSTHLSRLEETGYITIEKTFRGKLPQTLVTPTEAGLQAFKTYRLKMKQIMDRAR